MSSDGVSQMQTGRRSVHVQILSERGVQEVSEMGRGKGCSLPQVQRRKSHDAEVRVQTPENYSENSRQTCPGFRFCVTPTEQNESI